MRPAIILCCHLSFQYKVINIKLNGFIFLFHKFLSIFSRDSRGIQQMIPNYGE